MAELFSFEIHTPYRLFFSGQVEAAVVNLDDGELGIYAHHAPITAPVSTGLFRIKDKTGRWKQGSVTNGILTVTVTKAVLLVDAAEWPEEIDIARAEASLKKAEEVLKNSSFKFETDTAKAAIKRAKIRLKAAGDKESTSPP
jgi:F-type H+-transporting ATPase subunit epsilon